MAWTSPTSVVDNENKWSNEANVIDGDVTTSGEMVALVKGWIPLELYFEPAYCDRLRFFASNENKVTEVRISYKASGDVDWTFLYQGSFLDNQWVEKSFPAVLRLYALKFEWYSDYAPTLPAVLVLYEVQACVLSGAEVETAAITVADLITGLNEEIRASESATAPGTLVSRAIWEALTWLSMQGRWRFLYKTAQQDVSAGTHYLSRPSDAGELDTVFLNDGTLDKGPLEKLRDGYIEWRKERKNETSGSYREPTCYAERGSNIYLQPIPAASYTATISYWSIHAVASDVTTITILFPPAFRRALLCAVIAEYLDGKGRHNKSVYYRGLAVTAVSRLRENYEDALKSSITYEDL